MSCKLLKDHFEGQDSHPKMYLLILLYTTKLKEGSLDVDDYFKSMLAIWRRFKDINLKLHKEFVVLMILTGGSPPFGTQKRILEARKDLSMEMQQRSFETQSLADPIPQGHLAVNLVREGSRESKPEKVWCEHCSRIVTIPTSQLLEQTWKSRPSAA